MLRPVPVGIDQGQQGAISGYAVWLSRPVEWRADVLLEGRGQDQSRVLDDDENLLVLIQGFPHVADSLRHEGSAVEKIRKCVRVRLINGTDLAEILVIHTDPGFAVLIANGLPDIACKKREDCETREREIFLKEHQSNLDEVSIRWKKARASLRTALRNHGMDPTPAWFDPENDSPGMDAAPEIMEARWTYLAEEKSYSDVCKDSLAAVMAGPCLDRPAIEIWTMASEAKPVRQNPAGYLVIGSLAGLLAGGILSLCLEGFKGSRKGGGSAAVDGI